MPLRTPRFHRTAAKKQVKKKGTDSSSLRSNKILVLDLEKLAPVVQIFDEIGINRLDNHKEERPFGVWQVSILTI